jgi:hypothetical protein
MSYIKTQLSMTPMQIKNFSNAFNNNNSIKLKLNSSQLKKKTNLVPLMLTKSQFNKLNKNIQMNKGSMVNFSMSQMKAMKKEGGILPFIIPMVIAGASALATGALSAVGGIAVNKIAEAFEGEGLQPLGSGLQPLGSGLQPLGSGFGQCGTGQCGGHILPQGLPPGIRPNDMGLISHGGQISNTSLVVGGQKMLNTANQALQSVNLKIGGQCQCGQGLMPLGYGIKKKKKKLEFKRVGSGLFPHGVQP